MLNTELRINRLVSIGIAALPRELQAAAKTLGTDMHLILHVMAQMVAQAMTELTAPPDGYEIEEEVCNDGESPDAAGIGGAPPSCYWTEWKFSGNGEFAPGYSSHALACCAAWDHRDEIGEPTCTALDAT